MNSYFLLVLGAFFIFIGIFMWKKDRDQIKAFEGRLAEKEKSIYELYESLEEIMEEMELLYRNQLSNKAMSDEFQGEMMQNQDEDIDSDGYIEHNLNEYNVDTGNNIDGGYNAEDGRNTEDENHIGDDNIAEENDLENVVIKLSNYGYSEEEIARKLGIGKGEVKLILGLNK